MKYSINPSPRRDELIPTPKHSLVNEVKSIFDHVHIHIKGASL